jgi:Protein of unknown function (DUF5672)
MLSLPSVTVCAISTVNIALTQRAIDLSCEQCAFGDAVFLTSADVSGNCRIEKTKAFRTHEEVSEFMFRDLVQYIHTPFVLLIQWDGYVTSSEAWNNEFLEYDYIGAKWPWHKDGHTVGNGGFSLRSRKLLELLASDEIALPGQLPEDDYICRTLRPKLEKAGIRFAPERIANRFAYERAQPIQKTFGFHGPFNMWRHIDYSELESVIENMDDYAVRHIHYAELMNVYHGLGRFDLVDLMANRRSKAYTQPPRQSTAGA